MTYILIQSFHSPTRQNERRKKKKYKNLKGQLCWFLTLSLSILIRDIMWNLTIYFFNVLCVSGAQLQNLLLLLEPVMSLVPGRTTNCLPLAFPLALYFCYKYTVQCEICPSAFYSSSFVFPWAIQFFVMHCILVHVGTAKQLHEQGSTENLAFSVNITQIEEFIA